MEDLEVKKGFFLFKVLSGGKKVILWEIKILSLS